MSKHIMSMSFMSIMSMSKQYSYNNMSKYLENIWV